MSAEHWHPPTAFDEYRLIRSLGRGRAGVVYLAHDTLLDRHVALKFIPSLADEAVCQFLIEARAAARIQHPNVAALFRVGQLDGRPFLVSEFVRGKTLDRLPNRLSAEELHRVAVDLCRGLAAAHRRGVLHRDIKSSNAILTHSGEAKLLDFGLARLFPEIDDELPEPIPLDVDLPPAHARPAPDTLPGDAPIEGPRVDESSGSLFASVGALTPEEQIALQGEHTGALLGTPHFMSPEVWRREPATERSDLYSLGVVLFELAAGRGPFREIHVTELRTAVLERDPPALRSVAPAVPAGLAEVIDRCLRRDPADRFPTADDLLASLERLRPNRAHLVTPSGNPYRGLRAFEPEHRAVFFGRQRVLTSALDRLRSESFLLIIGDSGVGKSSLAAAGLLPHIADGELGDARRWIIARMVPGRTPVEALAHAVAPLVELSAADATSAIRAEPTDLARMLGKGLSDTRGALLYVDQFEELVTLASPEDAAIAAQAIGSLVSGLAGVRLLATCRSDFLSRLEALPGLRDRVSRALLLLAPLGHDEMREAIVGPAAIAGGRFEPDALIDNLVDASGGGMPLLSFALAELWERRDADGVVRPPALEAIGGLAGALSRHADGVLSVLSPEQRAAARAILLRLVTVERTRARRGKDELAETPEAHAALDALVGGRLVIAGETPAGSVYEIAHEVLVHGWATLAAWLAEDAERRAVIHRVEQAAADWRKDQRAHGHLWSARQLAPVLALPASSWSSGEREFIAASTRAARRRSFLVRAAAAALVLALVAVWLGATASARRERERQIDSLLARAKEAPLAARTADSELAALRKKAFDAFDAGEREAAEVAWAAALTQRQRVLELYRGASEPIERALLLDSRRASARRMFAELLFERALVAEREHDAGQSDELVRRIALYDDDGELGRRWVQPAALTVDSEPSGAEVVVRAYHKSGDRWVLGEPIARGRAPLSLTAPPGSLRIELTLPGRASALYPVFVARGETKTLRIPLLAAIPDRFVWIPPGETLFGSSEPEAVRSFFNGVPAHPLVTDGYLIARHETTFAEWIAYLESLPAAERELRRPRNAAGGAKVGFVELVHRPSGEWQLALKPGSTLLSAVAGQPIRYPERSTGAAQDWLRMPVVAVSFDDAQAYAAWLATSGKVRGARLCREAEWERAARGADGRLFPHGDRLLGSDANIDETYGKRDGGFGPDEVGSHAASQSPFGVDDLSGNVWEWTRSQADTAVARGGSFSYAATTARIANRELPAPTYRDISLGFRVCASTER